MPSEPDDGFIEASSEPVGVGHRSRGDTPTQKERWPPPITQLESAPKRVAADIMGRRGGNQKHKHKNIPKMPTKVSGVQLNGKAEIRNNSKQWRPGDYRSWECSERLNDVAVDGDGAAISTKRRSESQISGRGVFGKAIPQLITKNKNP